MSSRLLHVSPIQRHQQCKTSRRSLVKSPDIGLLNKDVKKKIRELQGKYAVHAASPKTSTLRSLFTSLIHESFGGSGMNQCAQGPRGALVKIFCIECELSVFQSIAGHD